MSGMPVCDVDELRKLFLFEHLDQRQLEWLCSAGVVKEFPAGPVYTQGEPATCFFVLLSGTVALSHRVGPDDVEVTRSSAPGVYAGASQAYLGDRVPQVYSNTMRAIAPSRFFTLSAADFAWLMHEWFPMPVHLLEGLFFGGRMTQQAVRQRERLLALGTLSAGLTHELNNPAAAAARATAALRERVGGMHGALGALAKAGGVDNAAVLECLVQMQAKAVRMIAEAPVLSVLETADREDEVGDWLEQHGLDDGWELAPVLVSAGLDTRWLEQVAAVTAAPALPKALRWLGHSIETELLLGEIESATSRISALVGAARQYSQLDRAPYGRVDVHELLDSTLTMLQGKVAPGVTVVKEYDRSLPPVPAYASELNQVWTNLIDNALYAMGGKTGSGVLTVSTSLDRERLAVSFHDTGAGVPEAIRERIFEPFFTSKPVGDGTGLGLDISWRIVVQRHHGDLTVESEPGNTVFTVHLPLTENESETETGNDAPTEES